MLHTDVNIRAGGCAQARLMERGGATNYNDISIVGHRVCCEQIDVNAGIGLFVSKMITMCESRG